MTVLFRMRTCIDILEAGTLWQIAASQISSSANMLKNEIGAEKLESQNANFQNTYPLNQRNFKANEKYSEYVALSSIVSNQKSKRKNLEFNAQRYFEGQIENIGERAINSCLKLLKSYDLNESFFSEISQLEAQSKTKIIKNYGKNSLLTAASKCRIIRDPAAYHIRDFPLATDVSILPFSFRNLFSSWLSASCKCIKINSGFIFKRVQFLVFMCMLNVSVL